MRQWGPSKVILLINLCSFLKQEFDHLLEVALCSPVQSSLILMIILIHDEWILLSQTFDQCKVIKLCSLKPLFSCLTPEKWSLWKNILLNYILWRQKSGPIFLIFAIVHVLIHGVQNVYDIADGVAHNFGVPFSFLCLNRLFDFINISKHFFKKMAFILMDFSHVLVFLFLVVNNICDSVCIPSLF